jgi:thiamine biosynthesis protein ThiC
MAASRWVWTVDGRAAVDAIAAKVKRSLLPHCRGKGYLVETYAILRRSGWRSGQELEMAAARSRQVGDEEMSDDIRWIRSYVLEEGGSAVGTVCIYQATSEEAVREHASRADLPVDEVIRVVDTVVVRPDPEPAKA